MDVCKYSRLWVKGAGPWVKGGVGRVSESVWTHRDGCL